MALMRSTPEEDPDVAKDTYTVTERLYRTATGKIVKSGAVTADALYATPGDEIPMAEAEELGLVEKAAPKPADKQRKPAANK
jgi:hypothetical protein